MFRGNKREIPDKTLYCVREAINILTDRLDISESAARCRIYRSINKGDTASKRIVGVIRVTRNALMDLLEGTE